MRDAATKRTSANARHSLQLRESLAQLAAQPLLCLPADGELVEAEQRGADDRRRSGRANRRGRRLLAQARVDRRQEVPVDVLEDSTAEQHLDGLFRQVEPRQRHARERDHLGRELLHDLAPLPDSSSVDRLREVARRRQAEVGRNSAFEARARTAPVLAPRRGRDGGQAQVVASAPVARDRTERGKAGVPAVGCDADAVDPGTARDRDAPAALRAGTQNREGVVPDVDARRPGALGHGLTQRLLFRRKVDACHQERGHLRHAAVPCRKARVPKRALEQAVENGEATFDAEMMRGAERPAHEREDGAVRLDEREIRLRVAAVDGEDGDAHRVVSAWNWGRCSAPASRSLSTSSSESAYWPIKGCVSSALRATAGSPLTAALAASRSYAVTCCIRPSSSGATGGCGSGVAPSPSTRHGTSTTSSSARPPIVPSLRTSTTCTSPPLVASEPTRPIAASL